MDVHVDQVWGAGQARPVCSTSCQEQEPGQDAGREDLTTPSSYEDQGSAGQALQQMAGSVGILRWTLAANRPWQRFIATLVQ